jgi:hypothetical protein
VITSSEERLGTITEMTALPLGMVLVQLFTTVMLLLSKVALNTGMHPFVLIAYRNLVATAVVAPLALIFERYIRLVYFSHASFERYIRLVYFSHASCWFLELLLQKNSLLRHLRLILISADNSS